MKLKKITMILQLKECDCDLKRNQDSTAVKEDPTEVKQPGRGEDVKEEYHRKPEKLIPKFTECE